LIAATPLQMIDAAVACEFGIWSWTCNCSNFFIGHFPFFRRLPLIAITLSSGGLRMLSTNKASRFNVSAYSLR
jgi:hypothetical protein